MTSRAILCSFLLVFFVMQERSHAAPQTAAAGKPDGATLTLAPRAKQQVIAIFPDRTTGRDWGLRYLHEGVQDINRVQPDAVFSVGDLVQGYTRLQEEFSRQQTEYLTIVGALKAPYFPTPGNHDVVSGSRDAKDRTYADLYRERFGPLYFSTELELVTIIVLFTEDGDGLIKAGISDAQVAWLEESLASAAARKKPIVLLMHRPLWHDRATKWEQRIDPLLAKYNADWVIAGHFHALQDEGTRGSAGGKTRYLILGTCGGSIDQHPLAGQLQHLTFLVVHEDGKIEPYHQIAGTTLPVDWMRAEDQATSYKLKGGAKVIAFKNALIDPLGNAAVGTLEVEIENPLDVEINISAQPIKDFPQPWTVGNLSWISRTPIDIFNPFVTDLNTPFVFFPIESKTIAPHAKATMLLGYSADGGPTPVVGPEVDFIVTFMDSQHRTVPVHLRRRLPIARTITINDGLRYPITAWEYSEYDELEANGSVLFASHAPNELMLDIRVPDELLSTDGPTQSSSKDLNDPARDLLRIELGEGASKRTFICFIETGANIALREWKDNQFVLVTSAVPLLDASFGEWHLKLTLDASLLPEGNPIPINIGIADNDGHYHTQWRWLAPKGAPATLKRP